MASSVFSMLNFCILREQLFNARRTHETNQSYILKRMTLIMCFDDRTRYSDYSSIKNMEFWAEKQKVSYNSLLTK